MGLGWQPQAHLGVFKMGFALHNRGDIALRLISKRRDFAILPGPYSAVACVRPVPWSISYKPHGLFGSESITVRECL